MAATASKIMSRIALRGMLTEHKSRGERIVFANGCFDTLHVGHVRYLEGAKQEGDILVVGINDDASVGALKGAGRPILDEQARATLVAALRCVQYVVLFSEFRVDTLLEELRPDVHAKGQDYAPDTVPERATALQMGIRIAIVGDPKNHSTRGLFGAIRTGVHG